MFAPTEMMVTIDQADVGLATAAGRIVFFRFPAGSQAFSAGPVPCGTAAGALLSYRVGAAAGSYTDSTITTCGAQDWYVGANNLVAFSDRPANPTYIGLLAPNPPSTTSTWGHDAYFYLR